MIFNVPYSVKPDVLDYWLAWSSEFPRTRAVARSPYAAMCYLVVVLRAGLGKR